MFLSIIENYGYLALMIRPGRSCGVVPEVMRRVIWPRQRGLRYKKTFSLDLRASQPLAFVIRLWSYSFAWEQIVDMPWRSS